MKVLSKIFMPKIQRKYLKIIFPTIILLVISGWTESSEAATYYVSPEGNDSNVGTIVAPFRTFKKSMGIMQNGDTLNVRAGTYRLMDENNSRVSFSRSGATENNFVTVQSYNGEKVRILGSLSTEEKTWEQYNGNIYRLPVDYLPWDPSGMFNEEKRIEHLMKMVDGVRSHADEAALTAPGNWTKADAAGVGCAAVNQSCYIYLYPPDGENPNAQIYELSQRGLFHSSGTSYLKIKGLEFAYTQNDAFAIEGGRGQIIEDNIFSHNSNSNDNAYAFFISYGGGAVVRGNKVFDSKYWGGTPNSKGITFMDMDPDDPSIVEDNEVYDIVGQGICTKSGVSNLVVRRNYIHNVGVGIQSPGPRCDWTKPDCVFGDSEYYPGGSWKIYENILADNVVGVDFLADSEAHGTSNDNVVYNNVFYKNKESGINFSYLPSGNVAANNIFLENARGIYLNAGGGGVTRTVEDFLPRFSSNHNLFYYNTADYFLRPNWGGSEGSGTGYALGQIKNTYSREVDSLLVDPLFENANDINFHLRSNSPAKGSGDASFCGVQAVDMGIYPDNVINIDTISPANPGGLTVR